MKKKTEIEERTLKPILESFEIKFMSETYELSPHWRIELKKQIQKNINRRPYGYIREYA
ncbi:MAG: hypothetical protein FWH43_02210 [Endomicrobia bacterium]|nr:hypothetical protein [Endomicrobiia bacterium]